jgi:adenosylcobinamide-GDP ribazoletransferase
MPQLQQFLLALTFYTRLPGPQNQDYTKLPQATIYLPLVGWIVGAVTALSFYVANLLWQQEIAVILALIVGIFLTGAFHEDGFADVCDGFGGGWGKQRIMEIMKDSFIGVYAVIGLIFIFLLKISSKAAVAVYKPARRQLILVTIVALIPLLLLPLICLLSIIPLLLGNVFLGRYFYRHIGGYTGDCLGASQQLTETIFYLSISALWIYI